MRLRCAAVKDIDKNPARRIGTRFAILVASFSLGLTTNSVHAAPSVTPIRSLEFINQTPVVQLGDATMRFALRLREVHPSDQVVVELFNAVATSVQLNDIEGGAPLQRSKDSVRYAVSDLLHKTSGTARFNVLLASSTTPIRNALTVDAAGVYPLRVSVRAHGQFSLRETDPRFITWMVVANQSTLARPTKVSWLWTLPELDRSTPQTMSRSLTLVQESVASLARFTFPTAVSVSPSTLLEWQRQSANDAQRSSEFQTALSSLRQPSRTILNAPYTNIDPLALEHNRLLNVYDREWSQGSATLTRALQIPVAKSTAAVQNTDPRLINRLKVTGVDQVVIDEAALAPIDNDLRQQRFGIAHTHVQALATSTEISTQLFAGNDRPARRAQRFAATLALLSQRDSEAGVVIAIPIDRSPSADMIAAIERVLNNNSLVSTVSISDAFATVARGTDGQGKPQLRKFLNVSQGNTTVDIARFQSLETRVAGYRQLVGVTDPTLDIIEASLLEAFNQTNSRELASHNLDRVQATMDALQSTVGVSSRTITLTSEQARVPLSLTNTSGRRLRIKVHLDGQKITQHNRDQVFVLPSTQQNQTVLLSVRVRGGGEFPVRVTVTSENGAYVFQPQITLHINSTVFGTYGSLLTYSALGFLVLWWIHHAWKRRRTASAVASSQ